VFKTFLKNNLTYNIGNFFTLGISIFLLPIYTKYLSPNEFGIIDLFMVIGTFINLTIALEISQGLGRYYQEAKNDREKKDYTSSAFWFTFLVYSLFFFLSFLFSDFFSFFILDDYGNRLIFLLAIFAIVTNGIFIFTQNQLKWQIQPKHSVIASLVYFFVLASVTIYLLVIKDLEVESVFIGQISGNIIASILAIFYARKNYGFIFRINKFKEMVFYSSPLVLSSIGIVLTMYVDRFVIKDLLSFEELGIYGVAFRFTAISGFVIMGFKQSLTPLIFKNYKKKETPSDISNIFNIFIISALIAVAGSIMFAKEIFIIFTTEAFYSSANLIAILIMAVFFHNMYIFAPGLLIAKRTKFIPLIAIASAALNLSLNYAFIPSFGLLGAAYASLISAVSSFLFYFFMSNKYYNLPYQYTSQLFSFTIVIMVSYSAIKIFDEVNLKTIIIKIIAFFLIILGICLILLEKKYSKKININIINEK
jgi:O-antigen/teichoic acid export membrane protein